ncbi:hypothetical protein [uncultured Metabacillus sp.]|uniref:hypothetical protein n=1 Tax=uncultured Metabacillus sp. TaxID=2860135 RepID=UPI0026075B25|nr:hypothetical protein [uncultured Metabacillus sp.]
MGNKPDPVKNIVMEEKPKITNENPHEEKNKDPISEIRSEMPVKEDQNGPRNNQSL